ncbi:MAG: hypothetical protein COA78_12975 [Blastopirellula sp.]|nr:MAG: hypothetical protein COA78_12975 [Blastopirellula sp.]
MLLLTELVEVVNRAAIAAADTVRDKNMAVIEDFFEYSDELEDETPDVLLKLESKIEELEAIVETMKEGPDRDKIKQRIDQLNEERERYINSGSGNGNSGTPPGVGPPMRPKMVAITYPKETIDGPASHIVLVPLIALTPMSMATLSKLTFRTDLDIHQSEDGELKISFPEGKIKMAEGNSENTYRTSTATLEITLDGTPPSQGMKKLIEGYERALRAQIPG